MTSTGSSIGQFEISRDDRDHGWRRDLAQTVIEVSLCPMCTRALKSAQLSRIRPVTEQTW